MLKFYLVLHKLFVRPLPPMVLVCAAVLLSLLLLLLVELLSLLFSLLLVLNHSFDHWVQWLLETFQFPHLHLLN